MVLQEAAILSEKSTLQLRKPESTDGLALQSLVRDCQYLDENSLYCYLLVCTQFRNTSVIAEWNGIVQGFVSAFVSPDRPQVLFVWQVAVRDTARKQGLAHRMILEILQRKPCEQVLLLETTVTRDNTASRRLFESIQAHFDCAMEESSHFDKRRHFGDLHETEYLLRIGPMKFSS